MKLSVEESPSRARMKKSLVPKKAKEKETGLVYVRCVLDPVPWKRDSGSRAAYNRLNMDWPGREGAAGTWDNIYEEVRKAGWA